MANVEITQALVNAPPLRNQSWGVGDLSRQSLLGAVKLVNGFGGATNKGVVNAKNGAVVGALNEEAHIDFVIPGDALVRGAKIKAVASFVDAGVGIGNWGTEARFGVESVSLDNRRGLYGGAARALAIGTLTELEVELRVLGEGDPAQFMYRSKYFVSAAWPSPEAGTPWQLFDFNTQQDHILSFTAIPVTGGATDIVAMQTAELQIWRP